MILFGLGRNWVRLAAGRPGNRRIRAPDGFWASERLDIALNSISDFGGGLGDPSLAFRVPIRVGRLIAFPTVRVEVEGHGVALSVDDVIHCVVDLLGLPKIAGAAVIGPAPF